MPKRQNFITIVCLWLLLQLGAAHAKHNLNELSDGEWVANHPSKSQDVPDVQMSVVAKEVEGEIDDNLGGGRPSFNQSPQLPKTWQPNLWIKGDPFNTLNPPMPKPSAPAGQPPTYYTTHTDSDGNLVHSMHIQPLPSMEDFLKSQYNPLTSYTVISKLTTTNQVETDKVPHIGNRDIHSAMLNLLKRANINPDDVINTNGETKTTTRVTPDGRTVTTTYSVRAFNNFDGNDVAAAGKPSNFAPHRSTTAKALVRDREPLESELEEEEE